MLDINFEEFAYTSMATLPHIDNTPPLFACKNLKRLTEFCQLISKELGNIKLWVLSGYRCNALNALVKDHPDSLHTKGLACDFIAPEFGTAYDVYNRLLISDLKFAQLNYEKTETGIWVHVGIN